MHAPRLLFLLVHRGAWFALVIPVPVWSGATFDGANLDGAVFEDALIGNEDVKRL